MYDMCNIINNLQEIVAICAWYVQVCINLIRVYGGGNPSMIGKKTSMFIVTAFTIFALSFV
jgi:hypothetical protein